MKTLFSLALILLCSMAASAKESANTLLWPSDDAPVIHFTLGKFVRVGSTISQTEFKVEVTAENLWNKPIPSAMFDAYFFGKDNVRIGTGYIHLSNLGANETVRFWLPFTASGSQPVAFKVVATQLPNELANATQPRVVSDEPGALVHDVIEMRDGSSLVGDVESMDASSVVARIAGNPQSVARSHIKRILFAQREAPAGATKQ